MRISSKIVTNIMQSRCKNLTALIQKSITNLCKNQTKSMQTTYQITTKIVPNRFADHNQNRQGCSAPENRGRPRENVYEFAQDAPDALVRPPIGAFLEFSGMPKGSSREIIRPGKNPTNFLRARPMPRRRTPPPDALLRAPIGDSLRNAIGSVPGIWRNA